MPLDERRTEITDELGRSYSYTCIPFKFDKAWNLKLKILRIIVKPIGDALGELLSGDAGDGLSIEETAQLAGQYGQLGAILGQVPERLIEAGGASLVAEILSQTIRIGDVNGTEKPLRLSDENNRSLAYSGGNFRECYRAIRWVLGVNYAPFSADGSHDWSKLFGTLTDYLPLTLAEKTPNPAAK
jgi:hypothetical protein